MREGSFFKSTRQSEVTMNREYDPEELSMNRLISSNEKLDKTRRPSNLHLKIPGENVIGQQQQEPSTSVVPTPAAHFIKKHDIGFKNLTYTVKVGFIKRENKCILRGLNGNFRAGELTAVVGPSGAGKSSLLNVLTAYVLHNYTGQITINGSADLKKIKNQLAYITQDAKLQPFLTVSESMYFSANLKIGAEITKEGKKQLTKNILKAIGMYDTRHTRTDCLSGGQKKRLSIALELVSNPSILVLDEPTSGLDSSISTQCVILLKKLAEEGRTVICTIHQPSALLFGMFDHLYALAEGRCIYSGGTQNLLRFLAELNLNCPEFYNPSDYLLEIATNDYGVENNDRLVEKIQNGACESYLKNAQDVFIQKETMEKVEKMMAAGLLTPVKAPPMILTVTTKLKSIPESSSNIWGSKCLQQPKDSPSSPEEFSHKPKLPSIQIDPSRLCNLNARYAAPFHRQLGLLLMRTFLVLWRDKSLTALRLVTHTLMGLFVGILYYGIGNEAHHVFNIYRYIFFSIMFVMYTAFSSIILNFPLEFSIIAREHFNRWYSLRAYYVALTLADVPIQLICTLIFVISSYILTNQPLELIRITMFFVMVMGATLVAQSIALSVGAIFDVKNGAIFGPFFISPFLIFSGFFVQLKDVDASMQWLFHISFLKYSLEGSALAIFGYNRTKLECSEMFCQFVRPHTFLKVIGMESANYLSCLLALLVMFAFFRTISFYIMSLRLRLFRVL